MHDIHDIYSGFEMAESAEKREEEQEGAYLSLPSEEDERFEKALTRSSCSYESGCGRYRVQERRYATQYAHVYFHRLEKMRGYVTAAAIRKWREGFLLLLET